MKAFIDDHRGVYGVEPICKVLPIAPSTYREHAARKADPDRRSERDKRDEKVGVEIRRVFNENFGVYGVRKVWRQMKREGFEITRCTMWRLPKAMALKGAVRGKVVKTKKSDKAAPSPLDHVKRNFKAPSATVMKMRSPRL